MTSRDFCYWLQGLFELGGPASLNERQTDLIKRHLNMVFIHEIDPSFPAEQQDALDDAHSGTIVAVKEPHRQQILRDIPDGIHPPHSMGSYISGSVLSGQGIAWNC